MDRRTFLRGATVLGSGVVIGTALAGCSGPSPHDTSGGTATSTTGHGPPDWSKLAASLGGALLLPTDSGYTAAGHLYNSVYTQQAAAIAQCQSAGDVQRCLSFARDAGVQVAARSGGHSYAAYSSCPGLVIDVTNLHTVSVDGGGLATVGAGTVLIDVYSQLAAQGRLLPGGSCPTVGIAGLALGGGVGVFGRAYGLTCDQLQTVDVVTADGVLHRCGPGSDEDLYWACRGGGGGNFGVVTSFGFRTHPIPEAITLFTLEWPWGAAGDVLDAWLRFIPSAPERAVGQLPALQQRIRRRWPGQGDRCVRRSRERVQRRTGAPDQRSGHLDDLRLRRARGLPDGDHDRGRMRGEAGGPVRRARPVPVRGQVLLHRRPARRRHGAHHHLGPLVLPGLAPRRGCRRRLRRLRRRDQHGRSRRHGLRPPVRPSRAPSTRSRIRAPRPRRARRRRPPTGSTICSRPSRRWRRAPTRTTSTPR